MKTLLGIVFCVAALAQTPFKGGGVGGGGAGAANPSCTFIASDTGCTTPGAAIDVSALAAPTKAQLLVQCFTGATTETPAVSLTYTFTSGSGIIQTVTPAFSSAAAAGYCAINGTGSRGAAGANGATGATGATGAPGSGNNALCADASGSSTTYTCPTPSPTVTTLTGLLISFIPQTTNSGSSTVNVAGLGAKTLKLSDCSTNLSASALTGGSTYIFAYNGTNFCQASSSSGINSLTGASGVTVSAGSNPTASADTTFFNALYCQLTGCTYTGPIQTPLSVGHGGFRLTCGAVPNAMSGEEFFCDASGNLGFMNGTTANLLPFFAGSNTTTPPSLPSAGVLHVAGSTVATTSSLIVNADITNATIDLTTKVTGALPQANIAAVPLTTGTSVTLTNNNRFFTCTGTCTVTVPVPAAGVQYCVFNDDNVATVITLAAIGSSARYENTARTAYGTAGTGTMVSGGAAGDSICIVGRDSTHYFTLSFTGTWTAN